MLFYILNDVVRLRILRERVYPGLFGGALNATTSVYKRSNVRFSHRHAQTRSQCEDKGRSWSDEAINPRIDSHQKLEEARD